MNTYHINEIFYSLQGEGVRAGTANVFVRFAGCNLACKRSEVGFDCDTDHSRKIAMNLSQLVAAISEADDGACRWVIFTGGEPALQLDEDLILELKRRAYRLAIETNGTQLLPLGLDWVTVSPKTPPETLLVKYANEVKVVVSKDTQLDPHAPIEADHYLVSPAFVGAGLNRAAVMRAAEICMRNPLWRLTMQQHKIWGLK